MVINNVTNGEGNGTPLQYSCLENPMDGGAWWAAVHGIAKSWTQLSDFTFTFHFHALEEEVATHSSILAWRIPGTGAWWAAIYGVAQSRTRLTWLSSSSSVHIQLTISIIYKYWVQCCWVYSCCCSELLSSYISETLYTLSNSPLPLPPAPGNHNFIFCPYEIDSEIHHISGFKQYLSFCDWLISL